MKQVMIDLETLGTTADAVIMSIGAVVFDFNGGIDEKKAFYASVSIDSNLEVGRKIQEDTLIWWMGQSPEAKRVFEEPKVTLEAALDDLAEWFPEGACAWSNGASFDIAMLEHAYKSGGNEVPWKFWDSRCVRTYRSLPGAERVPKLINGHHALLDAVNQVRFVQAIHQEVFGAKTAKKGVAA